MEPLYLPRSAWEAKYGPARGVPLPYNEVVVHTAAGADRDPDPGFQHLPDDATVETVKAAMRAVENFHRHGRGWESGVGYNFMLFGAVRGAPGGVVCEGQGWGRRGTHTEGRNSQMGVCFYGHGDQADATDVQWAAAQWLIREGLRLGRIVGTYKVSGHRDYSTKGKTCPGNLIYPQLGRLRGLTARPTEDDDMTPEQDARLRKVESDLAAVRADLAKVLGQLNPRNDTKTSVRDLLEKNYNRLRKIAGEA